MFPFNSIWFKNNFNSDLDVFKKNKKIAGMLRGFKHETLPIVTKLVVYYIYYSCGEMLKYVNYDSHLVFMLHLCMCGFPPGTPSSSHNPKQIHVWLISISKMEGSEGVGVYGCLTCMSQCWQILMGWEMLSLMSK